MNLRQIEEYLNNIDFSLLDASGLNNIYLEIADSVSQLSLSQYSSTNLEKVISISSVSQLSAFLEKVDFEKVVYKKLGSRIIEAAYKRLFEEIYIAGDASSANGIGLIHQIKHLAGFINIRKCIKNENATHVLRSAVCLITGKQVIDNSTVKKYTINGCDRTSLDCTISEWKSQFRSVIPELVNDFSFITLLTFIQCTRSQSLIEAVVEGDLSPSTLENREYFYEGLCWVGNRKNMQLIYDRIFKSTFDVHLEDSRKNAMLDIGETPLSDISKVNYFLQAFLKNTRIDMYRISYLISELSDENSNIILSLLINQQNIAINTRRNDVCCGNICDILNRYYSIENGDSMFHKFLLEKYDTIDTKYVPVIVNFMKIYSSGDLGRLSSSVNSDFVKFFNSTWIRSKSGKELLMGFIEGNAGKELKTSFFNQHIDLFWNCHRWKFGRMFIKRLVEYTSGHSRKKAREMLIKA